MIISIHFSNFKALNNFGIHLKDLNILTGPNNNGKSTILDGIRALNGAYRYASRYTPKLIDSPFGVEAYGYEIPNSSIPITIENIQNNYNTAEPAKIKYKFKDGQSLTLFFHPDHPIYLLIGTPRKIPKTREDFKKEFPVSFSVIPTLGPFEINEEVLKAEYVNSSYGSSRSARMFRNYWFYNSEEFDKFQKLVETTWPGMSVSKPERKDGFSKELVMFCYEDRMAREICWAGFGFQIWLQLLTHIVNSTGSDLIVVDEPEIYLHPDLQHKVLKILKQTHSRIIVATHSVEIINDVEPSDVLLIDKNNKNAKRITDLLGLQGISSLLGSGQNLQLTKLARGKKILFVEGKDSKLLIRLAKNCNKEDVLTSGEITVIPIDGFSQHDRIIHSNWAFSKILGENIEIFVLLDRDYKTDEYIASIYDKLKKEVNFVHILEKKEIENYFLIPNAILKAIDNRLEERIKTNTTDIKPSINIENLLRQISDEYRSHVSSQLLANKLENEKNKGKDNATIIKEANEDFEFNWRKLDYRLRVISGKNFLHSLNTYLQNNFKINITYYQIAQNIRNEDLGSDIKSFFDSLELFQKNNHKSKMPPLVTIRNFV